MKFLIFRPLKWLAPETLEEFKFSHASDVWAFGVTLWEMYSLGGEPYGDIVDGDYYLDLLYSNRRLDRPKLCPKSTYDMMYKCWHKETDERPTFSELIRFFE